MLRRKFSLKSLCIAVAIAAVIFAAIRNDGIGVLRRLVVRPDPRLIAISVTYDAADEVHFEFASSREFSVDTSLRAVATPTQPSREVEQTTKCYPHRVGLRYLLALSLVFTSDGITIRDITQGRSAQVISFSTPIDETGPSRVVSAIHGVTEVSDGTELEIARLKQAASTKEGSKLVGVVYAKPKFRPNGK